MRRCCFFCLLLLLFFPVAAQEGKSLLKEGKAWNYDYHQYGDPEGGSSEKVFTISYTLMGDTLINGQQYHKMYRLREGQGTYYGAYREEGRKVYCLLDDTEQKEIIAADFDYNGLYNPYGYDEEEHLLSEVKDSTDNVIVDGISYLRHHYMFRGSVVAIGVEGIGYHNDGLNYPAPFADKPTCLCDYAVFTSCTEDGKTVFTNDDFVKVSATDIHTMETEVTPTAAYDLQGRRLGATPQHGVYIQNGKKYVVK